jgi:Leucine-rich repeat (LRR) protein
MRLTALLRRSIRIRLRTVLIAITIACIGLAVLTQPARKQESAVRWIREHGGNVQYRSSRSSARKPSIVSWMPKWLIRVIGDDYFNAVTKVTLVNASVQDISHLSDLPDLEWLKISTNKISDLRPLSRLKNLRYLDVTNNQIEDLSPLAGMNLETLVVGYNHVSDVSPLASCTSLKHLLAFGNDELCDLTPLTHLPNLHLDVHDTPITDEQRHAFYEAQSPASTSASRTQPRSTAPSPGRRRSTAE